MHTHKCGLPPSRWSGILRFLGAHQNGAVLLGIAFAFLFCGLSTGSAIIAYRVDSSSFGNHAVLAQGGSVTFDNSRINGNAALIGASAGGNNDVITGNLSYSTPSLSFNNTVKVLGKTSQDFTLTSTAEKSFSETIASFDLTQPAINGDRWNNTITGNGGLNVISINGGNINNAVTLNGSASDIFYINVSANLSMSAVNLNGVDAKNVFWNILGGNNNLGGTSGVLNGTFLAFNTQLNINHATLNGDAMGSSVKLDSVVVNGVQAATAMAPEASSTAAMVAFACLLLASPLMRYWKSKQRAALFGSGTHPA